MLMGPKKQQQQNLMIIRFAFKQVFGMICLSYVPCSTALTIGEVFIKFDAQAYFGLIWRIKKKNCFSIFFGTCSHRVKKKIHKITILQKCSRKTLAVNIASEKQVDRPPSCNSSHSVNRIFQM